MKLRSLIKKLKDIESQNDDNLQVRMADYMPVVKVVVSSNIKGEKCIIVTDRK
jgi:hypothetical protein